MREVISTKRGRQILVGKSLIFLGSGLVGVSLCLAADRTPLIIGGLPGGPTTVDGDTVADFLISDFNPHLSTAFVDILAPGCTAYGMAKQVMEVPPLTSRKVTYPFDPRRLRVGPVRQEVVLAGRIGEEPFRLRVPVAYIVERRIK